MTGVFRIALVGAATLRGKEVAEALVESVFASADIVLLDDDAAIGQLEPVGDEISFVKPIDEEAFDRQDFVFFAGSCEQTEKFWRVARAAGGTLIDLSQALTDDECLTMFPWQREPAEARLDTLAVEVAHPAAQALAMVAERAAAMGTVELLSATVLEPASEQDRSGMDELHQQTVKLLSFQPLPREVYDAQVAFNVLTSSTESAKNDLDATEQLILSQYAGLSTKGNLLAPLLLQIGQAPVFHGYVAALHLRMTETQTLAAVQAALAGPHVTLAGDEPDSEWPSNLAVSGQSEILLKVRAGSQEAKAGRDFRLWLAMDNLRVAALMAVDAAAAMRHLRPRGEVQ